MWRSGMIWQFFVAAGVVLIIAVLAQGLLIGWLVLGDNYELPQRRWEMDQIQVWLITAVIGIGALIVAAWWTRRAVSPLQELAVEAEQIAAGDYGRKVFIDRDGELGILARSFNYTSERLATLFNQLDEDRQQLRAVLSSMVDGVLAIDSAQNILFANDRAAHLLDLNSSVVVGRRLWEIVRHRGIQELVTSAISLSQGCYKEFDWHGPKSKSLTLYAGPLPGTPPRGLVLVLHDNTELRRLERVRQDFVANVSHELKTPLSVIKANVETLLDGAVDDEEHRGVFLQRVLDQADHLNTLIMDLLSLTRIEGGTETFVFQEIPIERIVTKCVDRYGPVAESKQQTLKVIPPKESVEVFADEEAMRHIVDNLVDNAVKYTPLGGRIHLRWWADEDWSLIEVKDTGLGIPRQDLQRIFERFYRVDKARSRELGGTGLGLAIVKHLVQAMQGSIQATSELNQGSTFTVRLPRRLVA